jgi:hypothetical protein
MMHLKIIRNRWPAGHHVPQKQGIAGSVITGFYLVILYTQLYFYINKIVDPYWKRYAGLYRSANPFPGRTGIPGSDVLPDLDRGLPPGKTFSGPDVCRTLLIAAVVFVGAHIWSFSQAPAAIRERIRIKPDSFQCLP